ncbi:MAG: MBL fold metallo-hydrolase [Muribaculaceae bacterium]|nr:MBL fold metallo-hydrolase [Muribaculaceae bacterium]
MAHWRGACVALPAFRRRQLQSVEGFGNDHPEKNWIWLPVSVYLIEHPQGLILVDTGWHRDMSPNGMYDKRVQIKSLGSWILYHVNQGRVAKGEAIDEQLATMGITPDSLDYVLLTHLDCDHANGLRAVKLTNTEGKFVLLFADGGYATKS